VNRQLKGTSGQLDELCEQIAGPGQEADPDVTPGDAAILRSLPGVGRMVLATLLSEASDPLSRRDHQALRNLCGGAPVTRRSGKRCVVTMRRAAHVRASVGAVPLYHWSRVAIQHDAASRTRYAQLRERGHSHPRALRSVADRLLNVACAMLRDGALFNPEAARSIFQRIISGRHNHSEPPCQKVGSPSEPSRLLSHLTATLLGEIYACP
jgi:transposase